MIRAWLAGAAASTILTLVLLLVSRLWRRDDAAFWHALWTALAGVGVVGAGLAAWLPHRAIHLASAPAESSLTSDWWPIALVAVYIAGLAWYLLRLVIGWALLMRLSARADAPEGALASRLHALAPTAAPLVRIHRRMQTAATWGWRRPVILLPPEAVMWRDDRLRAVLEHEYAHVERADVVSNLVAEIYRAIYWPNPLAAIAARRVRLQAEIACDARASARVGRQPYARALLLSLEEQAASGMTGILAPGAISYMRERIGALVRPASGADTAAPTIRLIVIAAVLAGQTVMMGFVPDIARVSTTTSSESHTVTHQAAHVAAHAVHKSEHGR